MEEAVATLVVMLFVGLFVWAIYTDNNNQARCKSLEMVMVTYAHDSYCAKVEDLKK